MAGTRRSSRIRKGTKSPSPAAERASKTTAIDTSLPSLAETDERRDTPDVVIPQSLQQTTPVNSKHPLFTFATVGQRTPRNRIPMKPSEEEMHPQLHHQTTTKPLDEARWLGFLSKGPQTEPSRAPGRVMTVQATPTKIPRNIGKSVFSTPEFNFRLKRPSLELSPEARRIMEETREEAASIRAQMIAAADEFSGTERTMSGITGALFGRKIAHPKGKAGRFSDVHMEQFKKMDSIANHASSFRADPNRLKYTTPAESKKSLKRSPSKAELDKPDQPPIVRVSPSKSRLPGLSGSRATPRATIKLVTDSSSAPVVVDQNKRVKRRGEEDTSTTRPSTKGQEIMNTPKSALPRPQNRFSRLSAACTPTKASIARSQSAKAVKTASFNPSNIPSLTRTASTRTLSSIAKAPSIRNFSPSRAKTSIKEGIRQIGDSIRQKGGVRGILRSPQRHFSNDPLKIAAGTHVATPDRVLPEHYLDKELPAIPATAPVIKTKHVMFTASTVAKEDHKVIQPATDNMQIDEEPELNDGRVVYPSLEVLPVPPSPTPSRRSTLSDLPIPGSFTFRSDHQIVFGPATSGTIRKVRPSNPGETLQDAGRKRKLGTVNETEASDKENTTPPSEPEEVRSSKKARMSTVPATPTRKTPAKTPGKNHRRPDSKRPSGMTSSRLNFLAMPKRRNN